MFFLRRIGAKIKTLDMNICYSISFQNLNPSRRCIVYYTLYLTLEDLFDVYSPRDSSNLKFLFVNLSKFWSNFLNYLLTVGPKSSHETTKLVCDYMITTYFSLTTCIFFLGKLVWPLLLESCQIAKFLVVNVSRFRSNFYNWLLTAGS